MNEHVEVTGLLENPPARRLLLLLKAVQDAPFDRAIELARIAEVFVCPGYRSSAPDVTSMEGRKSYLLNDNVNQNVTPQVQPFGYPGAGDGSPTMPIRHSQIASFGSPSSIYAITDVDKINIPDPTVSWWSDLPYKPVHGDFRNELYFDWHVAAKRAW